MNDITVRDIVPPRGQLMLLGESQAYVADRINTLEEENKIDQEFAEQLRREWT